MQPKTIIPRPANYEQLSGVGKAIVDNHIEVGVMPPPMTPYVAPVNTREWNSPIDDD